MPMNRPLVAALALTGFASFAPHHYPPEAQPVVVVDADAMPKFVPAEYLAAEEIAVVEKDAHAALSAVEIYHSLRGEFAISHKEMAGWLGLKRRTLYNWLNDPERSTKYGAQVEQRLSSLLELRNEMESEHYRFLYKIAFSPIYGEIKFGGAILSGASSEELVEWYDKLFSRFESYRAISSDKDMVG